MTEPRNLHDWEFFIGTTIVGKLDDGQRIRTSPIVARDPETNVIQTHSGSLYRLCEHGGQGHSPELMWDENGWCVGTKAAIPRIDNA